MQIEAEQPDTLGGSCLFAVYDPVDRACRIASAGHPPPLLVTPDGRASFAPITPGPLIGVGNNPFEVTTLAIPPGSTLVSYTDGLLGRDVAAGAERLGADLADLYDAGAAPSPRGDALPARMDQVLVCEVADPSSTQPRLRRALTADEGAGVSSWSPG